MNNLGLTEEQVQDLMYEMDANDEGDNCICEFISKKFVSNDAEKSHVDYKIVVKQISTGKFFKAVLGESPWYMQSEHNASQTWTEVKPKETKTVEYE